MAPQDNRLTDGAPMRPVSCGQCGSRVLVRKSSLQQTSVQWNSEALRGCTEHTAAMSGPAAPGALETCHALGATIRAAALNGTVEVLDDEHAG
ncbi:ferredoxin [Streptomyces sp. B-S-A8]|uniref:Ferredoxin n=1 Tax=Streptomyces solicavernae TaxID=3043614 RepID=A0ABT6RVR0_9ACTN|nr:ferredoxin [Streptomyces sp. B-S-A8]MDI3388513.1 ferredoxin [Streptomyces sp. B-S-A8]